MHYKRTRKLLNLKKPVTFSEKMQYIKLYRRDPLMTLASDKFKVRKYLENRIPEEMLTKLLWVGNRFEDIPFTNLPQRFVIKVNHGSGCNIFVNDKSSINKGDIKDKLNIWMKTNFHIFEREWC